MANLSAHPFGYDALWLSGQTWAAIAIAAGAIAAVAAATFAAWQVLMRWEERRRRETAQRARAGLRRDLEAMAAEAQSAQEAAVVEEEERALPPPGGRAQGTEEQPGD